jgi:tRNA(Ile)-lysidine synthase
MADSQPVPVNDFEALLAASWPPDDWKDVTILVAVSGGGDSVALFRGLEAIRLPGEGRLIAAHVNHKLRGADSDADQEFVETLCRERGIPCEVATAAIDGAASGQGQGLESAARRARYGALEETAGRLGARFVVTAQTADDQAETVLHRIVRGTGIRGLGGMARARPLGPATLLRPLLEIRRAELAAYLRDLGQPFRTDRSNCDMRFTRNRIRAVLLPLLASDYNHSIADALLQLGKLARESQTLIDSVVGELLEKCARRIAPQEMVLDSSILAAYPRHLIREVLIKAWRGQCWPLADMGLAEWDSLADMILLPAKDCGDQRQKRQFPGGVIAESNERELRLTAP